MRCTALVSGGRDEPTLVQNSVTRDVWCGFDQHLQLMAALHDMRLVLLLNDHSSGHDGVLMHISQTKACLLELIMFGLLDPKQR